MKKIVRYFVRFFTVPKIRFAYLSRLGFYNMMSDEKYLKKEYKMNFGVDLELNHPKTFNEKIQWLKLNDRRDIYTTMVDKYEAKKYVANIIGEEYIIPTIGVYDKFDEIDFDKMPNQFVMKCTHDSGGIVICKDKNKFDKKAAKKKINKFLRRKYYYVHREWPYKNVKPRIIVEKYMEDKNNKFMRDYKFFCFDGRPEIMYLSEGLEDHKTAGISFYDMDMKLTDCKRSDYRQLDYIPEKPKNFEKMKEFSAILSKGIPHLRVDWYEINGKLYFGELTFSTCAGLLPFADNKWNLELGSKINLPLDEDNVIDRTIDRDDLLISVIVPVYNSRNKIIKLIDSLEKQEYKKYEIIFVDDGSTDGTYEYLKEYSSGKNNVRLFRQDNSGPGIARKKGFKECKGELVYFVDSDDWLAGKNALSKMNSIFLKNKNLDACIANRKVYPSNEVLSPFIVDDLAFGIYNLDIFYSHLIYGNMSMKVFRRRVLSLDGFVGAFNFEDLVTSYIVLDRCSCVKYVNDYFYVSNHAEGKKSLTTQDNYEISTLSERAKNLIVAMNMVRTPQIKTALASTMFNTYCNFVSRKMLKKNRHLVDELKENILQCDLSGFYKTYSFKKRVLLFLIRLRRK